MEDMLKPCPFCGEPEEIVLADGSSKDTYQVICRSCGARAGEGTSMAIAAENWERRA